MGMRPLPGHHRGGARGQDEGFDRGGVGARRFFPAKATQSTRERNAMPPKQQRKNAPKAVEASYTFELGELCDWSGELTYSVKDEAAMILYGEPFSSTSSIRIFPPSMETTSKKFKGVHKTEIQITATEEGSRRDFIGFIEKDKDRVFFSLVVPWNIANHIHLILISKEAKYLTLTGTDIFRNNGSIYGIAISKDYEGYY